MSKFILLYINMSSTLVVFLLVIFFAITPVCLLISISNVKYLKIAYTFLLIYYTVVICVGVFSKIRISDEITLHFYTITKSNRFFNFRLYTPSVRDFLFNVVMFVPFGFFLSLFFKNQSMLKTTIIGMLASVFIELSQFFLPGIRCAELSDIILNTLGCAIGAFAFLVFNLIRQLIHTEYTT